jgi:hypothetical protein
VVCPVKESGSPVKYPVYPDKLELLGRNEHPASQDPYNRARESYGTGSDAEFTDGVSFTRKNVLVTSGNTGALNGEELNSYSRWPPPLENGFQLCYMSSKTSQYAPLAVHILEHYRSSANCDSDAATLLSTGDPDSLALRR